MKKLFSGTMASPPHEFDWKMDWIVPKMELVTEMFSIIFVLILILKSNSVNAISVPPFDEFNETYYTDCSHIFENRIALFEYTYYPSYWMYPSANQNW